MAPMPPLPNHPSFTRKFAQKVSSLIAKFEALSSAPAARKSPPPRKRTIASVVTPGASTLPRSQLRRSIRKTFTRWEIQGEEMPLAKIIPPPKKVLGKGKAAGRRRVSMPEQKMAAQLPGAQRRVVSEELDGPVPMSIPPDSVSTSDISASSVPPVVKIIPSSFFKQLVVEEPPRPKMRAYTDSEDESLLVIQEVTKVDRRKFRFRRQGEGGGGSLWKRRITPPKISVRDLVMRFKGGGEKDDVVDAVDVVSEGGWKDLEKAEEGTDEENSGRVDLGDRYSDVLKTFDTAEGGSGLGQAFGALNPSLTTMEVTSNIEAHGDLVMVSTSLRHGAVAEVLTNLS